MKDIPIIAKVFDLGGRLVLSDDITEEKIDLSEFEKRNIYFRITTKKQNNEKQNHTQQTLIMLKYKISTFFLLVSQIIIAQNVKKCNTMDLVYQ